MTDIQPYQFEQEEALQDEDDSDCFKEKTGIIEEITRRIGNTDWFLNELSVLLTQVTSEHLTFLLSAIESGIRCSLNGRPLVIWIISLHL